MIKLEKSINTLESLTCLAEKVAIYVPSTMDVKNSIDSTIFVERISFELSHLFGGCTSIEGKGKWISDKKGLISESVTIVYAFTSTINNEVIDSLIDLCKMLKKEMKQECVSLEINNKLYFV